MMSARAIVQGCVDVLLPPSRGWLLRHTAVAILLSVWGLWVVGKSAQHFQPVTMRAGAFFIFIMGLGGFFAWLLRRVPTAEGETNLWVYISQKEHTGGVDGIWSVLPILSFFPVALTFAAVLWVNVAMDRTVIHRTVPWLKKYYKSAYHVVLKSWRDPHQTIDIQVPERVYSALNPYTSVQLTTGPGALHIEWLRAVEVLESPGYQAPHDPARQDHDEVR